MPSNSFLFRSKTPVDSQHHGESHHTGGPVVGLYHRTCRAIEVVLAPWHSMHDPIKSLLNAEEEEADMLTARWKDSKLAELNYIGITVRSLSSSSHYMRW